MLFCRATTVPITALRHLLREDIATDIYRFPLLKPSTTPTTMTQKPSSTPSSAFPLNSWRRESTWLLRLTALIVTSPSLLRTWRRSKLLRTTIRS